MCPRRRRPTTHPCIRPRPRYAWIVVFGAVAAIFASFGIDANDVANAYATSVSPKALTIKQACGLAVIFEFLGAVLAGSNVAETIRKIAKSSFCEVRPHTRVQTHVRTPSRIRTHTRSPDTLN
jgi:phosphate/sulfate permease